MDTTLPHHVNTDKERALQAIRDCTGTLILDWDYTLYAGNSTEDYLGTLRPAWLAYAIISCVTFFVRGFGAAFGLTIRDWRDYLWVQATWFLMPWARLGWKRRAAALARAKADPDVLAAVTASNARRIIVVSFGFEHVQRAMLTALPFQAEVVGAAAGLRGRNLRLRTKRAAVLDLMSESDVPGAVFVTDSRDDLDLMDLFPNAHCVAWSPKAPFPFANVYVPFRYTAEGKYTVPDILWNQHFSEDLVVLLIAYATSGLSLTAIALLFVSFFCVYEMGYYENNTLAASREAAPNVSPGHARFPDYPIWSQSVIWSTVTGTAGCLLLSGDAGRPLLLWVFCLLGIRLAFRIFNTLAPEHRIFVFPVLQLFKMFAYAPIVGVGGAGVLLLGSQVMRQTTNYYIYRNGGDTKHFRRQTHRLVIFCMGVFALGLSGLLWPLLADGRFWIAFAWCVYRVVREFYGHGLKPLRLLAARVKGTQ